MALLGLAYAAMFTGDMARVAALADESLAAARASQDQLVLAQVLFFLAWVASNAGGSAGPAEALVTEALGLFAELGETGEHAEARFVLGTHRDLHRRLPAGWITWATAWPSGAPAATSRPRPGTWAGSGRLC